MAQALTHVALVVREYDEAIAFFCGKLRFTLVEDEYQPEQDKRWVVVAPPGHGRAGDGGAGGVGGAGGGAMLLLARATTDAQRAAIGNQTGGRVFLFLSTDDVQRDYREMRAAGITFVREPTPGSFGTAAVFEDLYGNRWDLVEHVRAGCLP